MSDKTNAFENALLNYLFRNTPLGLDGTNLWIALLTGDPGEGGDLVNNEITLAKHGQYARVAVVRTGAGFGAAIGGANANTANITWSQMTSGTGGTVLYMAVCTGGTIATNDAIYFKAVTTNKVFATGTTLRIDAGDLTVTEA